MQGNLSRLSISLHGLPSNDGVSITTTARSILLAAFRHVISVQIRLLLRGQ
jgi:hypothetical protein